MGNIALSQKLEEEKVINTFCNSHCGGACMLKVYLKGGRVTRIETDDGEEPQARACLKGRAYRQRLYAPDRLKYPMKRVGERGEGKLERISWDEALDTIARELKRVKEKYGPASIMLRGSAGDVAWLHSWRTVDRLLSMYGGYSRAWGFFSCEGAVFASLATYGTLATRNSRTDLFNSRLIIIWGCDPANSIQDTNTSWYLAQAAEKGIPIVVVDPKYTDTAANVAKQWIPIIPGTDAAMLIAMAYVMIQENLQDQKFLDTYTVGFDKFKDYVLGVEDGVPKTPAWAEGITGVPASTIAELARKYATTKPAAFIDGIGPGRAAYGEQYHRAAMTLAAMTGNIGIHGGDAAGRSWTALGGYPFMSRAVGIESGGNPIEDKAPPRPYAIPHGGWRASGRINISKIADAILKGKAGGYHSDIKFLWIVNTNYVNQHTNINKCVQALKALEFMVVHEQFMTPNAKFADILLPTNTLLERNDITVGESVPYFGCINKVSDSLYESKSHFEICTLLAPRLGIKNYTDKTEEQWQRAIIETSGISNYDTFRKKGVERLEKEEPWVAFKREIENPQKYPFRTPSGKIEIYSQRLADMNHPQIPPIPKYIESWEGRNDPLAKKYPLQLITTHFRRRAHTQYETVPWLRETQTQVVTINLDDARDRGICDGEMVRVFNDRGITILPAKVTQRIMRGVVEIPEGAWYDPDENGVDRGGNPNVLTKDEHSPGGAFCSNTSLVQVERA